MQWHLNPSVFKLLSLDIFLCSASLCMGRCALCFPVSDFSVAQQEDVWLFSRYFTYMIDLTVPNVRCVGVQVLVPENSGSITGNTSHLQNAVRKQTVLVNHCCYVFWALVQNKWFIHSGTGAFSLVKPFFCLEGNLFFPKCLCKVGTQPILLRSQLSYLLTYVLH